MSRKMMSLADLVTRANISFEQSADDMVDFRKGLQMFVDKILMDHGVYRGFRYLNGYPCEDESRIQFYLHPSLRTKSVI